MRNRVAAAVILIQGLLAGACAATGVPAGASLHAESEQSGWGGTGTMPDPAQIADGRRIAETECAMCHAIDARSVSPNPSALPFRDVLATNDPDQLAYRFIDAMKVGHDEMPVFDFNIPAADALIAYLKSISAN